jgi:hypothetical protein
MVAEAFVEYLIEWELKLFYIAAPPDESNFLFELIKIIESKGPYKGYRGLDLETFLPDCFKDDSQVFSSIEQQICSTSLGFLYSPGSSWSLNTAIGKNYYWK